MKIRRIGNRKKRVLKPKGRRNSKNDEKENRTEGQRQICIISKRVRM